MPNKQGTNASNDEVNQHYTPTTEEVRAAFRKGSKLGWHSRRGRLFDRWLAEVKAQAWEEGESDGSWNEEHRAMIERGNREAIANPYRQGENK